MYNEFDDVFDDVTESEENDGYDRNRSIAVLTGIVCMLVSLAGTVLGSYHAINTIGMFAGYLATACYIIADLVVYWAARIDYKEDGNAMEWTAWGVKYGLSILLLLIGGCVAYILFTTGDLESAKTATAERAQKAYQKCIESGSRQRICQQQYNAVMTNESKLTKETTQDQNQRNQWIEGIVKHPLFNYASGVFGLFGLIALSFVAKVIKKSKQKVTKSKRRAGVKDYKLNPAFEIPKSVYKTISNGKQSFRMRRQQGRGKAVRVSWRNNKREIDCGSIQPELAEMMQHLSYNDFAKQTVERMKSVGLNTVEIENGLKG